MSAPSDTQFGFNFEADTEHEAECRTVEEWLADSLEEVEQKPALLVESEEEVADPPVEEVQTHAEAEKNGQIPLINIGEWWEEHWKGMPEFVQKDISPFKTIYVHFEKRDDMERFIALVGQRITLDTKSIWYPEAESNDYSKKRYADAYVPGAEEDSES